MSKYDVFRYYSLLDFYPVYTYMMVCFVKGKRDFKNFWWYVGYKEEIWVLHASISKYITYLFLLSDN